MAETPVADEDLNVPGAWIRWRARSPFAANEAEIRHHFDADREFDTLYDDFARLAALQMLAEIDRLRGLLAGVQAVREQGGKPEFVACLARVEERGCVWPACDCDCDCFIPSLEGAGQHSAGCRCIKRQAVREQA